MQEKIKFVLAFGALFLSVFAGRAQILQLNIHYSDSLPPKNIRMLPKKGTEKELQNTCRNHIQSLHRLGYAAASLDSVHRSGDSLSAFFYLGNRYIVKCLQADSFSRKQFRKAGIKIRKYKGKPYSTMLAKAIGEKILLYYVSSGYPYCRVISQHEFFAGGQTRLYFSIEKNEAVCLENIYFKGSLKSSENFLMNYFNLYPGNLYNEQKLRAIPGKTESLVFARQIRPPAVEFYQNKADIYLYLEDQPANTFSGIVGLSSDSLNHNRLLFTGDIDFSLYDIFRQGEFLALKWQRIKPRAQLLEVQTRLPYPFGLPLEPAASMRLDRTDSRWLNFELNLGSDFVFSNNNRFTVSYSRFTSKLMEQYESENLKSTSHFSIDLGYSANQLDYPRNPSSGYAFSVLQGAGKRNNDESRETVLKGRLDAAGYTPLGGLWVIKTALTAEGFISQNDWYINELYKYGGYKSLRGFDENAFRVVRHATLTGELRWLYDKDAALYLFGDAGAFQDYEKETDFPFGFGLGTELSTAAGILTVNYALGKTKDAPLMLSDSKLHIAYSAVF